MIVHSKRSSFVCVALWRTLWRMYLRDRAVPHPTLDDPLELMAAYVNETVPHNLRYDPMHRGNVMCRIALHINPDAQQACLDGLDEELVG